MGPGGPLDQAGLPNLVRTETFWIQNMYQHLVLINSELNFSLVTLVHKSKKKTLWKEHGQRD